MGLQCVKSALPVSLAPGFWFAGRQCLLLKIHLTSRGSASS
ncbi:hypothetical protein PY32053_02239 [Paracoccus yeei]|uniref:Uncharacterized protein n=1 Tax=Paracoccus yeei TaxID=147645 RepID=A0A386UMG9_9RHOB|nr:hypothetical protein PY32053_02239 [Paracoccus yeei]